MKSLSCTGWSVAIASRVCVVMTALYLPGNIAFAQTSHPICQSSESDADGDGWGWENGESCIVSGSSFDRSAPVLSNCPRDQLDTDGDGFGWHNGQSCRILPTCRAASSDPDGDGYGWQDNASCIVRSDSVADHVNCLSADSDPDGDGFGFENGQTCLVEVSPGEQPVVEEPAVEEPSVDAPPTASATPGNPVCESADSDPDGDGFGYENGISCVVPEAPVRSATPANISLADVTEVIVVTGQSNALGSQTAFDEVLDAPHERVFAYTDDGWQIADLHLVWDDNEHPGNKSLNNSFRRPYNNLAFQFA